MLSSLREVLGAFAVERGKLIMSQVLLVISAAASLGIAFLTETLVNDGIGEADLEYAVTIGIIMLVLAVVSGAAMTGTAWYAVYFSQGTARLIRVELYNRLQEFSFENYDRARTGNLLVRLNADVLNVQNAVLYGVLLVAYAPFMAVIAAGLALVTAPVAGLIVIGVVAIILLIMWLIVPPLFRAYDERQMRLDGLNNSLQENLAGIRVVKAFVREKLEISRFSTRADAMRRPAFRAAFGVAILSPILGVITQLSRVIVVWLGGYAVLDGSGSLGEIIAISQYLSLIVVPLGLAAVLIPFLLRGDTSAARIIETYDTEPSIEDPETPADFAGTATPGRVVLEGVSFSYRRPDGSYDPPAVRDISLTIEPGERIGILGPTGAGKTTLVNLIPRFYDPTDGTVSIDGVDVRTIPIEDLRATVGVALQEAVLFQGDVRFNAKFGDEHADDSTMQAAAAAADAYGFVTNLPQQWDAPVARRGYNFSGGQRQRLSITRALVPRPRILILDDSTSATDAATEARIQDAIPDFAEAVTTIYVAQRISAVIDLDRVVLMDQGEIVAVGHHEELLETSPLYREIFESQLGADVIEGLEVEV